jgi:hypothetical protein
MGCGLDDRTINIPFPSGAQKHFLTPKNPDRPPRSHTASYSTKNRVSFPRNKVAGTSMFPIHIRKMGNFKNTRSSTLTPQILSKR